MSLKETPVAVQVHPHNKNGFILSDPSTGSVYGAVSVDSIHTICRAALRVHGGSILTFKQSSHGTIRVWKARGIFQINIVPFDKKVPKINLALSMKAIEILVAAAREVRSLNTERAYAIDPAAVSESETAFGFDPVQALA